MSLSGAAEVCTILSFVISLFTAYKVVKIGQKISISGNDNKGMNQTIKGSNNTQIGKQ